MRKIIIQLLFFISVSNAQWVQQSSGTTVTLFDISMPGVSTTLVGWAVGLSGTILRTTNGGTNWIAVNSPTSNSLTSVHCFNSTSILAVGWNGTVIKTTNNGLDWTSNFIGSFDLESVSFINSTTGFICGKSGGIWKTTNGGNTWNGLVVNSLDNRECYFINSTTGYTCGPLINTQTASVKRTTSGGASWQQPVNVFGTLNSITFYGDQMGWSCGSLGNLARTTNGGVTWSTYAPINSAITLFDIYFSKPEELGNGTTGWIAADSGKIYVTSNSGVNWETQITPVNYPLYAVKVIGNTHGWAVGDNGTILRTTNGGVPIGIQTISSEIPVGYKLWQNYPNPFNPLTNIEFSIPKGNNVKLEIFDSEGKHIAEIVNGFYSAGTYKADFEAGNLASGIYFYSLQAGYFSETKKMILIK
ncbi:MAG: T9SS type A sorting domain-containing protein [Ignavibacteria bacterium]|nr:T9SS type A sorting domain-containing protein [Ignavibacteria bacterium]